MKKRKLKHCLAVSTVVANMLMILITLSLAAILVAWAGTTYGTFTGGSQIFFSQRGQALQERFVVEEVFFIKDATTKMLRVFVRDVGVEQVNVVAIYVNGTSFAFTSSSSPSQYQAHVVPPCTISNQNNNQVVMLTIGNVCELDLNWGQAWTPGAIFNIVVASARGNQVTYTTRGP
jgi:hypothetical protein